MANRDTAEKWLGELTHIPTASGREDRVIAWAERWVSRRTDLKLQRDSGGNVLITQKGRKRRPAVLAVAHMDHPAFVIEKVTDGVATFEFRGGVDPEYFDRAPVEVVSRVAAGRGVVTSYDPATSTGELRVFGDVRLGDIVMWKMKQVRPRKDRFFAPACDDLAGVAAALAALDRARRKAALRHFGVLLTRAEEVGLIGAIHAAKHETIPTDSRLISIETSRELSNVPIGGGPVIRTGDRATVFDRELTNRISQAAAKAGIPHQRKLMDGGGCEATAFGAYGYRATGICLALGNWHNRGNLAAVEHGHGEAVAMLEEISLADFHGLIELLLVAAEAVDEEDTTRFGLERLYESHSHYLD